MDLNTITVADFKALFPRDFPYLPVYDNTELYNAGTRVYYPTTKLFYTCTVNGTTGILPTDTDNWTIVADSVENYVSDADIERAFAEAQITFNQSLFTTDANIKMGYLYLTAHYLVNDLRAALGGIAANGLFPVASRSVGNVSESYNIPQMYLDDPIFAYLTSTPYGMKYLSMIVAQLRGNVFVVTGWTLP